MRFRRIPILYVTSKEKNAMFFLDPVYLLMVMLPTLVITGLAQMWINSAYQKWGNITNSRRVTGMQTAQILLQGSNLQVDIDASGRRRQIGLQVTGGQLTDHYDPSDSVVRLSQDVATQPSIAAMAVAAHELGHVQQHEQRSPLMGLRTMLVPSARLGPSIGIILMILGLMMQIGGLAVLGLILFAGATLFTVVTLPVELDASRRGLHMLKENGLIVSDQDAQGAKAVLTAAAFTYVAAVATSLLTLLYYAMLVFGSSSSNRRR
jgi:Zn-dependent membrane protease YugP